MSKSWLPPASFQPPSLPVPDAATSRRSGPPDWVLLDTKAYITDDRRNGTTATASTRGGQVVKVTFWLADPPIVSHLCVHCPGLKESAFADEPLIVCSVKNIAILLISFTFGPRNAPNKLGLSEYFVYRAHPEHPSLHRLPSPHPRVFEPREVGLLPCADGDGDDFVLAALYSRLIPQEYDLHIYLSKTGRWSTKLTLLETPSPKFKDMVLPHRTSKVLTLEGGFLGWVDLWRGILLCNVLHRNPVARYIRLPWPTIGNKDNCPERYPESFRDVTCSKDLIKFIEIEPYEIPDVCKGLVSLDTIILSEDDLEENLDSTATRTCYGWRAAIWNRELSSKYWCKDSKVDVDEILVNNPRHSDLLPELRDGYAGKSTLKNLITPAPILSIHGDDVVYLTSKVNFDDLKVWVIGVDMKTKTLQEVALFTSNRSIYSSPTCIPCSLSRYLDMTSNNSNAGCKIEETNDSEKDPNDTTIVVNGLEPSITENNLRQVFSRFGEVQYVKVPAHLQNAFVEFIDRSDAENAIASLNGALIGAQNVHLSWGCSTLEQPPQQNVSHWNGASYYDYSRSYGEQRYSSTTQGPNVYTSVTCPDYSNYQQQQPPQQSVSQWNGASYHYYTQGYGGHRYSSPTIQNSNVYTCGTYPGSGNYQQQQLPPQLHRQQQQLIQRYGMI